MAVVHVYEYHSCASSVQDGVPAIRTSIRQELAPQVLVNETGLTRNWPIESGVVAGVVEIGRRDDAETADEGWRFVIVESLP